MWRHMTQWTADSPHHTMLVKIFDADDDRNPEREDLIRLQRIVKSTQPVLPKNEGMPNSIEPFPANSA